jgi:hypothetical protein
MGALNTNHLFAVGVIDWRLPVPILPDLRRPPASANMG